MTYNEGVNLCSPSNNGNFTYSLDKDNKKLKLGILIGNLDSNLTMNDLQFLNSNINQGGKKFLGKIKFNFKGEEIEVLYSLASL